MLVFGVDYMTMRSCGLKVVDVDFAGGEPLPAMVFVRLSFDVVWTRKTADLGMWMDEQEMDVVRARVESLDW